MRGRRAFPASTVPRKPQQQKMRICSIAKGPLKERAFLLAYEMASGNLKHCARVGRDQGGSIKGANVFSFNPRARVGARHGWLDSQGPAVLVSIHAPARGATRRTLTQPVRPSCFNPRARAGRDLASFCFVGSSQGFQSTRPRGARRLAWLDLVSADLVSIHAPARGATSLSPLPALRRKFQSTRPRGARPAWGYTVGSYVKFQSTRPRGARPAVLT